MDRVALFKNLVDVDKSSNVPSALKTGKARGNEDGQPRVVEHADVKLRASSLHYIFSLMIQSTHITVSSEQS